MAHNKTVKGARGGGLTRQKGRDRRARARGAARGQGEEVVQVEVRVPLRPERGKRGGGISWRGREARERGERERREREREGKQVTSAGPSTPPHTLGYLVGGDQAAGEGEVKVKRSCRSRCVCRCVPNEENEGPESPAKKHAGVCVRALAGKLGRFQEDVFRNRKERTRS